MTIEELSRTLHQRYSEDAAQEALLALASRSTPPLNPMGFCARVAWRYDFGHRAYRPGGSFNHSTVTLDLPILVHPSQLDRVEARELLSTLDPLDLARGLGYLDPEPQPGDDPPRQADPRRQWTQRIRRQKVRRVQ